MKKISKEDKQCLNCMETHEVEIIEKIDESKFKNELVEFYARYEYCSNTDEYSETEEMTKSNDISFKDAYRRIVKLLTSEQIKAIREKYGVSQKHFSQILDWGMATITRYENHYVQDRAHDDILRKIDLDPKWFLEMIQRAKDSLSKKVYSTYLLNTKRLFGANENQYLIDSISALYATYDDPLITGGIDLNINRVVELINYLAQKVENMHTVKLMKMLWYSDILSYKRTKKSITGLAYCALPMGAVPVGYEHIVLLNGVCYETVIYGDYIGNKFIPVHGFEIKELQPDDISIIDEIINKLGKLSKNEIVHKMHDEDAYKHTESNCIIKYSYAEQLSLE